MNTRTNTTGMLCILMTLIASCCVFAQGYKVDWNCTNSGGGVMSAGGYKVNGTIGQPATGFTKNTSFLHWIGFWSGEVPAPTVAPTVAAAKLLANGTFISVSGKIATSAEWEFPGFFYLEESDRSSGIRVAFPVGAVSGLDRERSVVSVLGTMDTSPMGERQIAAAVIVITSTNPIAIGPLGMNNRTLGGGDFGIPPLGQYGITNGVGLNNVGLLVRTWGRVSYVDDVYMTISDGSSGVMPDGTTGGVRVSTAQLAIQLPNEGDYISVIGISSLYLSGAVQTPEVLPRDFFDVN